mmetsp:Transcript_33302/g.48219  ORF Transcript_33302/g.48219 Transcript_33302/m.48219 type:complete len:81 (+) Transcript_33302:1940-2182(+)
MILDSVEFDCALEVLVRIGNTGGCGILFKLMTFLFSMLPMLSECNEGGVIGSEEIEVATSVLVRPLFELELKEEVEELDG